MHNPHHKEQGSAPYSCQCGSCRMAFIMRELMEVTQQRYPQSADTSKKNLRTTIRQSILIPSQSASFTPACQVQNGVTVWAVMLFFNAVFKYVSRCCCCCCCLPATTSIPSYYVIIIFSLFFLFHLHIFSLAPSCLVTSMTALLPIIELRSWNWVEQPLGENST